MFNPIEIPSAPQPPLAIENRDFENVQQHATVPPTHAPPHAMTAPIRAQSNAACLLRLPHDVCAISSSPLTRKRKRLSDTPSSLFASLISVGAVEHLCETAKSIFRPHELTALLDNIAALPLTDRPKPLTHLTRRLPQIRTKDAASGFYPVYDAVRRLRPEDRFKPMRELLAYAYDPKARRMFFLDMQAMPETDQGVLLAALCTKTSFRQAKDFYEFYNAIASPLFSMAQNAVYDRRASVAYGLALSALAKKLTTIFAPVQFSPSTGEKHPAVDIFDAILTLPFAHQGPPMMALIRNVIPYQHEAWFASFIAHTLHATVKLPGTFQGQLLAYVPALPSRIASGFLRSTLSALHAVAVHATGQMNVGLVLQIFRLDVDTNIHTIENHRAVLHCIAFLPPECREEVLVRWASKLALLQDTDLPALYDAYMAAVRQSQGEYCNNILHAIAQVKARFPYALSVRSHFEILAEAARLTDVPDKAIVWSIALTMHVVMESEFFCEGIEAFFAVLQKIPEPDGFVVYAWRRGFLALHDSARVECFMHHLVKYIAGLNPSDAMGARRQIQRGIHAMQVPAFKEQALRILGAVSAVDAHGNSAPPS